MILLQLNNLSLRGSAVICFLAFALKLAEVSFLLDQLQVMVFAIELSFMCYVVRRADCATAMSAFEATLVVHCTIYCNLYHKIIQISISKCIINLPAVVIMH